VSRNLRALAYCTTTRLKMSEIPNQATNQDGDQIILDEDEFLSFCMHSCINRCMACSHRSGITQLQSYMAIT
jgi:hypothetical protein